jgi:hypothetical protein
MGRIGIGGEMELSSRLSKFVLFTVAMLVFGAMLAPIETRADGVLFAASGSSGVNTPGELVILNTGTGATTNIGALVDSSNNPYGVTGLRFDPVTGVLYGSTGLNSLTAPGHLVTINPLTGAVTDVGSFGVKTTFADITFAFDPTNTLRLYGYQSGGDHSLYTINLSAGTATLVGLSGIKAFGGEGLAADAFGTIFGTPTGCSGVLDTFSKVNGSPTFVANLSNCPLSTANINALAFGNTTGTLFGINGGNTGPLSPANLVTIDTTSGVVTNIGSSLNGLDALAFQTSPRAVPEPTMMVLLGMGLAGIVGRKFRTNRYRGRSSGQ